MGLKFPPGLKFVLVSFRLRILSRNHVSDLAEWRDTDREILNRTEDTQRDSSRIDRHKERDIKRPSIYDVHTEGEGVRLRWTHVGGGGQAPCGRLHRKLKLESTDVILSSSHAKKLVYFLPEFLLWAE